MLHSPTTPLTVTEDGRHALAKRAADLPHLLVAIAVPPAALADPPRLHGAVALRQCCLDVRELPRGRVDGEGHLHAEGPARVDAGAARRVLLLGPTKEEKRRGKKDQP